MVHTPAHASWLNQVEIYHSIIQCKVLASRDFADTAEVARTLNAFEQHYKKIAEPFAWNFTREKLAAVLARLDEQPSEDQPAAIAASSRANLQGGDLASATRAASRPGPAFR